MQIWVKVKDNLPLTQEDLKPSRAETQTNHKALEHQAKPQIWGSGEILMDQRIRPMLPKWAAEEGGRVHGPATPRSRSHTLHYVKGGSSQPAGRRPRTAGTSPTGKWTGEAAGGAGPETLCPPPPRLLLQGNWNPDDNTEILSPVGSLSPEGRIRVLDELGGEGRTSAQSPV